jgi:hypothetical protein
MEISLPPGVTFSRYQQVPEPSALQLSFVALAVIGIRGRMARRDDLRTSHRRDTESPASPTE